MGFISLEETIYGLYFRRLDYEMQTDAHNLTYFSGSFMKNPRMIWEWVWFNRIPFAPKIFRMSLKMRLQLHVLTPGPQYNLRHSRSNISHT